MNPTIEIKITADEAHINVQSRKQVRISYINNEEGTKWDLDAMTDKFTLSSDDAYKIIMAII